MLGYPDQLGLPARPVTRHRGDACALAAAWLPALAGGDEQVARRVRVHVQTCLRCQAELVRYRRLLRSLQGLRAEHIPPAPGSLAAVLTAIGAAEDQSRARAESTGRRVAYVSGMVATAAAGAAGALMWATRHRGELVD